MRRRVPGPVPSIGDGATVVATVCAVEGIAPRNPLLLFVLSGVLFRFTAHTPLLRPLFQFPPRLAARGSGPGPQCRTAYAAVFIHPPFMRPISSIRIRNASRWSGVMYLRSVAKSSIRPICRRSASIASCSSRL